MVVVMDCSQFLQNYCGFGKVYGCDFNPNFIDASKRLADAMNIIVDDWLICSEDALHSKCQHLNLDVIAGTDVIEHIYNLNAFFSNIQLLNQQMITGFTTASVYENYFKRKSLYKLMYQDEQIGSNVLEATSKDEFAGMPYLEIRKRIIAKCYPQLEKSTLDLLATTTRGLRRDDIKICVDKYLSKGMIEPAQHNKYNTCDPVTGNFTERMMTIKEYKKLYSQHDFILTLSSGFYAADGNGLKFFMQRLLNKIISVMGNRLASRAIAPMILLIGTPYKNHYNEKDCITNFYPFIENCFCSA